MSHVVTIEIGGRVVEQPIQAGETLREALLRLDCSPYRGRFRKVNCRGMGICGSCSVEVLENGEWWPRRSCQVKLYRSVHARLP